MSEQNVTRRDAVKLGGAALAGASLSAGASPLRAAPAPTPPADYPDFRGKTVFFYTSKKKSGYQILTDPVFTMLAGRLFLTGTIPAIGCWQDGLSSGVAWDLVDNYVVFDSAEDYNARLKSHKSETEARAAAAAPADQSSK